MDKQNLVSQIAAFLDGRKTYTALLCFVLYFAGVRFRLYDADPLIAAGLAAAVLAALRAGVAKGAGLFLLGFLLLGAAGCTRLHSDVSETDVKTGAVRRTVVTAVACFDSKEALAKFAAGQTDKSQRVGIGALSQEASGTNAVDLVERVVGAAVRAAVAP